MHRPAENQYAIHDLLKDRWSPRAFSSQSVENEKLLSLFEAARWSPSGGNMQPWTFIVGTKDSPTHEKLIAAMSGRNVLWTKTVPILLVSVAKLNTERPAANKFAYYDVGQAVAHLTVEATALGLHVHQMGGFDAEKVRQALEIPEGYEPLTIIAVGYMGKIEDLHAEVRERELLPRTRKPLTEFVYSEGWNQPLALPEPEPVAK